MRRPPQDECRAKKEALIKSDWDRIQSLATPRR
jgi:hypothetical protein